MAGQRRGVPGQGGIWLLSVLCQKFNLISYFRVKLFPPESQKTKDFFYETRLGSDRVSPCVREVLTLDKSLGNGHLIMIQS